MQIKMSKKSWEEIGKKAGWISKVAVIQDDGRSDGGEPYTDDEMDLIEKEERVSFTFGTTPEDVIIDRVTSQTPAGYPMHIKSQKEWSAIAKAVNKGIDSHIEGFTRSTFDGKTGKCLIHPSEMTTFLRRLVENGDEESDSLRMAILDTLGVEEI